MLRCGPLLARICLKQHRRTCVSHAKESCKASTLALDEVVEHCLEASSPPMSVSCCRCSSFIVTLHSSLGTDIAFRVYGVICLIFMGLFIYLNRRYQQQQEQPMNNHSRGGLRVDDPRQFVSNSPRLAPHGAPINQKWQTKFSSGLKAGIRPDGTYSTSTPVRFPSGPRFPSDNCAFSSIISRWQETTTVTTIKAIEEKLIRSPFPTRFAFVIHPLHVLMLANVRLSSALHWCVYSFSLGNLRKVCACAQSCCFFSPCVLFFATLFDIHIRSSRFTSNMWGKKMSTPKRADEQIFSSLRYATGN